MTASLSPKLAEAHDANYVEFSTSYARRPGSELTRSRSFDRAVIDLPALPYNGVFRSNLGPNDVARVAAETVELARARRVPIGWRVTPTTPPETTPALEKAGWHVDHLMPVMAKDLDIAAPATLRAGITVEEITAAALAEWSRVVAVSFGCPEEYVEGPASYDRDVGLPGETSMRRFLLRVDGEPSAASALLPGQDDGYLAGIYCVATLARARGQGLGSIVTRAAIDAAQAAGSRLVVLQASEMGRPVYERLGFDTVGSITVFIP
ncbi:MAG: GCN5-related protein N-acetyltransferase [Actinomycetia bacterium]|nr:GCN5-related protein N-acetyltransferase [Actinomycetes bacterium]